MKRAIISKKLQLYILSAKRNLFIRQEHKIEVSFLQHLGGNQLKGSEHLAVGSQWRNTVKCSIAIIRLFTQERYEFSGITIASII